MVNKNSNKLLRGFYTSQKKSIDELAPKLSEELRADFLKIGEEVATALNSMPHDDEDDSKDMSPEIMAHALAHNEKITQILGTMVSTQLASLDARIADAIKAKVDSGALISKEDVTKQVEAAKAETFDARVTASLDEKVKAGDLVPKDKVAEQVEAGKTEVKTRFEKLNGRRDEIVKASLPIPAESILEAADEAFKASVTEATARIASLTEKKLTFDATTLASLAWMDADGYKREMALVDQVSKQFATTTAGSKKLEPLAGAGRTDKQKMVYM